MLTLWQAKQLAKGNVGTFFMGDYRLLNKRGMSPGGVVYQERRHEPTKRGVSLVPVDDLAAQQVEVWTEVVRQVERASETKSPFSLEHGLWSQLEEAGLSFAKIFAQISVAEVSQTSKLSTVEVVEQFSRCVVVLQKFIGSVVCME